METAVNYDYPDLKSSTDGMKEIQKMITSFMSNMKVDVLTPSMSSLTLDCMRH